MGLGERVRQIRQSRGLTQEQLAGRELTKSFISLLERGEVNPSVETLVGIARRLGTSADVLLGSEGHIPDMAAANLLAMSSQAMGKRRMEVATALLGAARFVTETYALNESMREVILQETQLALERRDHNTAAKKISEALQQSAAAQDRWRTGRALVQLGRLQLVRREIQEAIKTLEQALAALRQAKASRDPARADALITLGTAFTYLGRHDVALKHYREAANAQATSRDPVMRGRALWGMGLASRRLGDLDRASKYLHQARDAFEATEELSDLAAVLHNLGQLLSEQQRHNEALRHLVHALRLAERLNLTIQRAAMLTEIARVHVATDNLEDGAAIAEQAIIAAQKGPDAMEGAEARTVLATACAKQGSLKRAKELMSEALATFRAHGAHARIAHTARALGETLMRQGAKIEAADQLVIALEAEDAQRKSERR